MRKLNILALSVIVAYSFSGAVYAGKRGHNEARFDDAMVDYAKVVRVKPLTRIVTSSVPRRECWDERVVYREPGRGSAAGTVLGGLIGGAIGNELGHHKSNKQVGAVAGALLGATIAHDVSKKPAREHYATEEVCKVYHDSVEEEQIVGYRVRYRYHGQEFVTRMDEHPGNRIKVRVSVSPVTASY